MIIYDNEGQVLLDILVDDNSYRNRAIMGDDNLTLHYSLAEHVELPVGSYCEFQNSRYTLMRPESFKMLHLRHFQYTVIMESSVAKAKTWKFRNPVDGRLKFPLTAKPHEHLQMFVDNMNLRDSGWAVGECVKGAEVLINYDHAYCYDALAQMASELKTEFEFDGKTVSLRKVEYDKNNPLTLSYGRGKGFKPNVGRGNYGDKSPVEILFAQGGSTNIDSSRYGGNELFMPKNQTIRYDGEFFEDEDGFISANARTYIVDDKGLSIRRADKPLASQAEDSLDCSEIYPKRVGEVTGVAVVDEGKNFYDFIDNTIPATLNYEECLIGGETMTVIFQSGMLAGKEFDVKYYHEAKDGKAARRFEIVPQEIDGQAMPNTTFAPVVGDSYAIFGCMLPDAYICDNATKKGAEWDMFRSAVKYMFDNEDAQFSFTGELDGLWAKKDWVNIGGKIKLGGFVRYFNEQFQKEGVLVRITGIKDYINNPHSPEITLSNSTVTSGFSTTMRELKSEEVLIESNHRAAMQYTKRRFRDAKETMEMLSEAMLENFTNSISPLTIQTMQMLVGDESLQFRFVSGLSNPVPVADTIVMNDASRQLTIGASVIQHLTLGINSLSPVHANSEYKAWTLPDYTSAVLDNPSAKYYLYAKCSQSAQTGVFALSEQAIPMETGGFYYLLVGLLNSEYDGVRSFVRLYGFTEILPGQITTDIIKSANGQTYFDLLNGIISGHIKFTAGSSGLENLEEWPEKQEQIDNAKDTAETAASNAENAQKAAEKAEKEAEKAQSTLAEWASDSVISPVEKLALKNEKANAEADYADIKKQTEKYILVDEVPIWNAFDAAYKAYIAKIDVILSEPGNSDVDNLQDRQAAYYSARTTILGAIATAAKKVADDAMTEAEAAKQIAENAINTASGAQSFIDNTITPELEELNKRLDGVVENWFYDYSPTTSNYPASEWTTENERMNHIGDTFTNTQEYIDDETTPDAGKSWRWVKNSSGSFSWTPIADSDAVKALQKASQAQSTADGKNRTFYNTPAGPYDKGDLWVQGGTGDIKVCVTSRASGFLSSDWALASKYTDDSALISFINGSFSDTIDELESQIDGKAETWYQSTDPATAWTTSAEKAKHKGDMWYNTTTGKTYRYNGSAWQEQEIPKDVFDEIDGKAQIFVSQPNPPYKVGDLWVQGSTGDILKCVTSSNTTYSALHWALASKYTDDSAANAAKAAADSAKTIAEQAKETADQAKTSLENMASDSIISPVEKTALAQQRADIMSEYAQIISDAGKYAVTTTAFEKAYNSALAALNKYTANPTQDTNKETDFDNIAAYYTARQTILDSIAAAAKKIADDAALTAGEAKTKADDAEVKATAAASAAAAALASASSALDSVGKINGDNYLSIPEKRNLREMMSAITTVKGKAVIFSGDISRSMINGDAWTVVTEEQTKEDTALAPYVGYYRSQNKGVSNSYSTTKLTFNLTTDAIVKISVASDGEANYDYLAVSKIDETETLTPDNIAIADFDTKGHKGSFISKEYGLKKGLHTLQIMYRKDASLDRDTDSGYYKITTEYNGHNLGLYGSFHRLYWLYSDKLVQESDNMYDYLYDLTAYLVDTCHLWEDVVTDFTPADENTPVEPFRDNIARLVRNYYEAEDYLKENGPVADLDYLTKTFEKGSTEIVGGVVMSEAVAVKNELKQIEAMLNGSETFSDEIGKIVFASGIPAQDDTNKSFLDRLKEAITRLYRNGRFVTKNGEFSGRLSAENLFLPFVDISFENRAYDYTLQNTSPTNIRLLRPPLNDGYLILPDSDLTFNGMFLNVYITPHISKMDGAIFLQGNIFCPNKSTLSGSVVNRYYASKITSDYGGLVQLVNISGQWVLLNGTTFLDYIQKN